MPVTTYSLADLEAQVLAYFSNRFPGRDLGSESWLGKQARAIALALLSLEKAVEDADHDASPSSSSSTAAIDAFAVLFGLPSNVPGGGYGRNGAVAASGGAGPVTGVNGTGFADGALLLASDGVTQFALSGGVTIPGIPPGSGSIAGKFVAVTPGAVGNIAINNLLAWVNPPVGGDASVELSTSGLTSGLDRETDGALLQRIFDRLQKPPKGGAAVDYRTWAEAGSPGVARAYVYPLRAGLGTVQTVLTAGGSGQGRVPSGAVQAAADAAVALVRPVTVQSYQSLLPAMPNANGLTIRVRVRPSAKKYAFDWDDTGFFSVLSYAAGPPAKITLVQAHAPASLQAAIGAGAKPRIFVEATGGPVIPIQVGVVAPYAEVAGHAALTLDTLPQGWVPPSPGDYLHAGGTIVPPIAAALLAYVDSLGPSRADGYADLDDPWDDVCAVARLTEIALDVADAGGSRFASNLAEPVLINGASNDVEGQPDIAGAPELLWAQLVVVTQ